MKMKRQRERDKEIERWRWRERKRVEDEDEKRKSEKGIGVFRGQLRWRPSVRRFFSWVIRSLYFQGTKPSHVNPFFSRVSRDSCSRTSLLDVNGEPTLLCPLSIHDSNSRTRSLLHVLTLHNYQTRWKIMTDVFLSFFYFVLFFVFLVLGSSLSLICISDYRNVNSQPYSCLSWICMSLFFILFCSFFFF